MTKLLPLLALALAALIAAASSHATYPGNNNGRLAFGITVDGNTDVYSVLPNGVALRRLTDDPGSDICPAYSADGKWIAWCGGIVTGPGAGTVEIWTMKQNGTEKRQITHMGGSATFPDFSPDATEIAFSGRPAGATTPDIYVIDSDGSDLRRLTTHPGIDRFPAWSPDGTKIVFQSTRTGTEQVWLMNADGSGQTQLTFDATPKDQLPDWSPDGSKIAYVSRTALVGGDIWVIDADGSDPHPVTSGADKLGAAWAPDGSQIATLDWPSRTVETIPAAGGEPRPVHPLGIQFVPAWQPRGVDLDD